MGCKPKKYMSGGALGMLLNFGADLANSTTYQSNFSQDPYKINWGNVIGSGGLGIISELVRKTRDSNQRDNAIISATPGSYADGGPVDNTYVSGVERRRIAQKLGGDIGLSSDAFQVKGNPNKVDGNYYPELNAKLDHNEVVKQNFVFSNRLKDPTTNTSYANLAARLEKYAGNAEKKVQLSGDEFAVNTVAHHEKRLEALARRQEAHATALGLRPTTPGLADGGPIPYNWDNIGPVMNEGFTWPNQVERNPFMMETLSTLALPGLQYNGPKAFADVTSLNRAPITMNTFGAPVPQENVPKSFGTNQRFTPGDYMQMATVLSKFGQTIGGAEKEKPYYDATNITKRNYDVSSVLGQNSSNYANTLNALNDPSISRRRVVAASLLANKMNADNQSRLQYEQMNSNALADYENRLSNQVRYNNAQDIQTNDINARNRAAYKEAFDVAANSVGNLGKSLNSRKGSYQAIELLRTIYPDVYNTIIKQLN